MDAKRGSFGLDTGPMSAYNYISQIKRHRNDGNRPVACPNGQGSAQIVYTYLSPYQYTASDTLIKQECLR